jgi:hypothetical protein
MKAIYLFLLLATVLNAEVVRFVAPSEPQTLRIESKIFTESEQGIEWIELTILPSEFPPLRAVWVEINTGSAAELQILSDGIPLWESIVDYTIVTTTPGNAKVAMYAGIQTTKPLVAGLKPLSLFNCSSPSSDGTHSSCDLNQPDAWVQYGFWIQAFIDATGHLGILQEGVPVFALENESILYETTIAGGIVADLDIIRTGLESFPKDVMYYWYPSVSSYLPERRAREQAIYEVVADVLPHVRFVDTNQQRHSDIHEDYQVIAKSMNESLVSRDLVNMIYVYPSQAYWKDSQVYGVSRELFDRKELIYYPGQAGFVEQGQVFSLLLPHRP